MTPERWERIAALYSVALELAASSRHAFLLAECSDDEALRLEVESLLSAAQQPGLLDSCVLIQELPLTEVVGGRFRITRRLGAGGMGVVYESEDLQLGGRVALKTIRPEIALTPAFIERFRREIRVARKVTHPNACRIYDVGFHPSPEDPNTRMFLTMELLDGETLAERLKRGPLTAAEAAPLVRQMAAALGAAHNAGVIHRDFKTSNVMLTPHLGQIRAVVMDFGLAGGFENSERREAQSSEMAGTPEYMAPEQLSGGAITPVTDIYALGIVMYEMVTGRKPFQGETRLEAAMRRLDEPPEPPRRLIPNLDSQWEHVILRCLSRRPEDRFQNVTEVLSALRGGESTNGSAHRWTRLALLTGIVILAATAVATVERTTKHRPDTAAWQQLTNYSDSVTDPVLSPDGRMLAFKRGGFWFMGPGQIYLKPLPDGQPVQLTHDSYAKMAPAFSPDSASVAYTVRRPGTPDWEIWQVPVSPSAGQPRFWLTNTEGLTWIDKQHILFSELKGPDKVMSVVTSSENRTDVRDVYVPGIPQWMAHLSALSPDRKQVLIVEMYPGGGGNFANFRCRLVPFDGAQRSRLVGPGPGNPFIAASWSPDGEWMYFSARTGDKFHLWRERADRNQPEQITFGPTEEQGLALAADGRSAITSVGAYQTTVWIHDQHGERQISGEGSATAARFAPDGKAVYYLAGSDLWRADLTSGEAQRVLSGMQIADYALSPDRKSVAYITADGHLWYGPIDRQTSPRQLAARAQRPEFTGSGDVLFRISSILYRIHPDGRDLRKVPGDPGDESIWTSSLSPDENWSIRRIDYGLLSAEPRNGGAAVPLL